MAGYQRNVGMLILVANVLLTLTKAQWLYQYPSQTHNWRQKFPQYTYPSPDRSYQTSHNPLNQPVKSHESVQSPSKLPNQRHQTPYYSHQQLKLNPDSLSTQQPISSWKPTKHPTKQPAALQRHVHHLTSKPLASLEPIHNTTRWPVESQRPAYDPSKDPGWPRQHAHNPFQQLTRSQQSINHSSTQHVTSQQPIHHSTQSPISSQHHHTSQKHTQHSTLQPIRSQQPTHHSSHQPILSQQHRHYLSQQLLTSQQHTNYPRKQPTRSQQATNYPKQLVWSQQPTHHLNQQPVRSQQPTRHHTQQSIRLQQSTYHTNQQPVPVHHANQQPIKSHQTHLIQKPQYHRAQLPDRRHQQAWYWHHYGNRHHQQWPQSTQAPRRPGHGNERFDSGQVLLPQPNKSNTDSTFSPSFPNNTETFTSATIIFTNSMTTTEKTISTTNLSTIPSTPSTTIIGISNATLPTESKPGTTAPTFSISSASPSATERTKIMTKMAITSFLPINKTTTSKPEVSDISTVDDLKNAFTSYVATVKSPAVTDTRTTTKTSPTWPFTMKPVQLIVKTQKYAEVSSPTTNNTEDLSYYMNGNLNGKLEEKSFEEFLNPANGQVSNNVSQKVCCKSKYLQHPPADKSQNVTELTDITTLSPLKFEKYGSDITDNIPQHNHDLVPHYNTATSQYPTEKALPLMPNDNNTTHLHNATDITQLLPSLSVSPHGKYSTSPPSSKGGDKSLFSKNNVTFSQSLTKSDSIRTSKLLTNDTSTSPGKETNPPQQSYLSSHMTWMGYVHPNLTRAVTVTFKPQTAGDPSMTSSPLELTREITYQYQKDGQKEAIILPAGNQAFPKKAQEHTTHPQHKYHGPHRLPVQQTLLPHLLEPAFPWNQHLNHPSSNEHPMQRKSSQGILPQFNPAKDVRFELTKLRETAAESDTKDVLPQFNPRSGLIFPLKESNNRVNKENNDSEGEINSAPKDLQPDPFHTVRGPSLQKHLVNESHNSDVIRETGSIHKKNLHEEPTRLFPGYENNLTSWKNESNTLKTPNEQLSFKIEENTTTPMPLLNISNTVPITVLNIKTPKANASSSTIPPIMSASLVHTTPETDKLTQKAIKTSTSLPGSYENIHDKPFPLFAGFSRTNTELMIKSENQSINIQPHTNGKNENSHDIHPLPQAIKGLLKPVPPDATNTTNTEDEQTMKVGNTSSKSIPSQNEENVEENREVVLPYTPLIQSAVPSQKSFSSFDEGKYIITGANNAAEATVTSKTNSQQQILLKPLYPQGLTHGLRYKPVLLQSIPPDQQPWKPNHDKPLEKIIPLELPDLMAPTRPLLSKKPTSEVSFNSSEAETMEFLPLTQRSQNLPHSQGLSGYPPAPEFTTMPTRTGDLSPQSHEFPLLPIILGQPLPTKQDVSLPLKQQKFPHPTKSQYLQPQRQTNSPSPTRKQVLPLSKQSQYLFSTRGPLHLTPSTKIIQSDAYLSLQNSSPPSTLLNETLGQRSQLLLQSHLPIQIKEKSPSSHGHFPTGIKENSPPHNLESSPQDHKLQPPSQHKLFDTPSTTGQVHEPTTAAGTRYIQPESRGETLQNTRQFTSDKFSITEPYKHQFSSTPASHSSTLTPIFHQPSVFASQKPYQSESLDYLFVKQSDKREIPDVQSTVTVNITAHATSTPMTIQEASEPQLSSIIRNDERLVNFLNALPNPFKGSVKVDRANLHNHNNVAVSNSYGNVIYQHGGITFIGEENNSDE